MNLSGFRLLTVVFLLTWAAGLSADDGVQQIRNVSKTPDWETHHATIKQIPLYVPAQTSGGVVEPLVYETLVEDEDFVTERTYARPLIALYEDGPVEHPEDSAAFYGHGERDFFAATSLDDGATWKKANLSRSADRSSISIQVSVSKNKTESVPYPGDVFRNFVASAGNKVLAVWASRYCDSGNPTYSLEIQEIENIFASEHVDVSHLGDQDACTDGDADDPSFEPSLCLYFEDYWHVAGQQRIKDFAEEEFPTIGEVPYGCVWTARGTLELQDDGTTYGMNWRKAERLTSGLRDVHRMEAACVVGAGCVVTWQEDPEGLRPGKGEGPGEGWSGAIAHHETDIWYSYIDWDNFDLVLDNDNIVPLVEYTADGVPQVGVPMSIPVRVTDNAMCQLPDAYGNSDDPYCYIDFDESGAEDSCATSVQYNIETPEGPTQTVYMCVAEDGRLMRGNTASTRARTNLRGYDSDTTDDVANDSAWVIFAYEESKGLGEDDSVEAEKLDMGKNIWYHTFDMFNPELVSQGMMLNQPALYPEGLFPSVDYLDEVDASTYVESPSGSFAVFTADPIYSVAGLDDENLVLYQTEIARRYSQITQPASKVGESGVVAFAQYKQGIVRQGGPADVFARRFIIPDDFDATIDNPYDYANMDCADGAWQFTDGTNPRYVKGLCLSSPLNMSGATIVECEAGDQTSGCSVLDFPFDDLVQDIDKSDAPGGLPKTTEWRQCQSAGQALGDYTCPSDASADTSSDLDDQSWENAYDVAKGHRGFMKGDFIMAMYAWSPNWEANAEGHDNYNLYVRRSFDGGDTWTTLPADFEIPDGVQVTADGSRSCEWYGLPGSLTEEAICFDYVAGDMEQARNLSQLIGTHYTVLDPRFAPTPGTITACMVGGLIEDPCPYELYPDDVTDPSKYFATFEVGDTENVAEGGEAEPMDMFYARAINYGDEYELADSNGDGIADVDPTDGEFEIFDKLEWHDPHAAEATLTTNPGGTLFYAVWNQWEACADGNECESDAIVRRTMELDANGETGVTLPSGGDGDGGSGPGGGGGGGGGGGRPTTLSSAASAPGRNR